MPDAEAIILGGDIVTMSGTPAEAVAVSGARIVGVGQH